MPKGIHCRANTNTLHHRNQYQQNYTRDKKAQRDQKQTARQKVKVVRANKLKVNVTNSNKATAIALSLLVFNASVFSDIFLSNPNTPPRIKNNQSTKNTQCATRYEPAKFNNHTTCQQPPVSKIMPVSVAPEQKNYLASNQSNLPKVDNNFKNDLNISKSNQNSSIEKNPQHKPSDSYSILNVLMRLYNYYNSRFYPISYQPPLENNIVREAALFKELLKPFENLDPLAQEKATLLTILHRLAANVRFDYDINTAGVTEYWYTTEEILARDGKGIDCEDYAILANFYAMHAQELLYLPQDANFGIFRIPGHALFYYERTLSNTDNPEFYIIDSYIVRNLSKLSGWLSGENYLKTLKQYISNLDIYLNFFLEDDTYNPYIYFILFKNYYKNRYLIANILAKANRQLSKPSRVYPGVFFKIDNLKVETIADWNKRINDNRQIDNSISDNEILQFQYNYKKENGGYSIPDDIEFSENYIDYVEALEIKNILGYKYTYNEKSATITSITANQAKYLIGSYSQNLNKFLTINDLPTITEDQKEKLLGMYSPVLNRQLINEDVFP